jgi:hypothetical protein
MHSTIAPRHSGRARRSVEDKEPSSSSEDSIRSPEPPPAQGTKLKRENDLHTQDPLNPYDPPLVTYHLHTSSIQSRGARGESDDSAWSLPSDVPIFPHICEKTTNDREFIAGRLSFLRAAVAYVHCLDQPIYIIRRLSRVRKRTIQNLIYLFLSSTNSLQTQPNLKAATVFRLCHKFIITKSRL